MAKEIAKFTRTHENRGHATPAGRAKLAPLKSASSTSRTRACAFAALCFSPKLESTSSHYQGFNSPNVNTRVLPQARSTHKMTGAGRGEGGGG